MDMMNNFNATTFLADSVEIANGKIYALGIGWDTIFAKNFPAQHSRIGLGVLISVPYNETNKDHQIQISLQDQDGQVVNNLKLQSPFKIGRPPYLIEGDAQIVPFAFNFDGLVFEKPSTYRWVIEVNDEIVGGNSMRVSKVQ